MAVSVQLITLDGQWVLQRRSQAKRLFAGRWANSCCTHPAPTELPEAAASRRLSDELGVFAVPLFPAGAFTYRATDEVSGLVEHEFDQVFVGFTDLATVPDPSEIGELWSGPLDQAMVMVGGPEGTPWATTVLRLAANRACALLPYLRRDIHLGAHLEGSSRRSASATSARSTATISPASRMS
ncbi:MAG TPA: NUDIX domain-containing protein [Acidimicrobiales bacterium]|nr:NUDIX domain-containing protein [Acidimicrobiales bacterium]